MPLNIKNPIVAPVKDSIFPGLKLGKFTILASAPAIEGWKVKRWKCQCECGEVRIYSTTQFKTATSCGCIKKARLSKLRVDPTEKINTKLKSSVYSQYARGAERRSLEFALSRSFLEELSQKNCYYCDSPPSNRVRQNGASYYYSGIDRIDNDRGYLEDNVYPCCRNCNSLKGQLTLEQFVVHIKKLYLHVTKVLKM